METIAAIDTLKNALTAGTVPPMQALKAIHVYRLQHLYDGIADILTDAVRTWHDAETAQRAKAHLIYMGDIN